MKIIQSVIIHDVVCRPKIVLDQLAEGLDTLGFRKIMQTHLAELFKELFVPTANKLNIWHWGNWSAFVSIQYE